MPRKKKDAGKPPAKKKVKRGHKKAPKVAKTKRKAKPPGVKTTRKQKAKARDQLAGLTDVQISMLQALQTGQSPVDGYLEHYPDASRGKAVGAFVDLCGGRPELVDVVLERIPPLAAAATWVNVMDQLVSEDDAIRQVGVSSARAMCGLDKPREVKLSNPHLDDTPVWDPLAAHPELLDGGHQDS